MKIKNFIVSGAMALASCETRHLITIARNEYLFENYEGEIDCYHVLIHRNGTYRDVHLQKLDNCLRQDLPLALKGVDHDSNLDFEIIAYRFPSGAEFVYRNPKTPGIYYLAEISVVDERRLDQVRALMTKAVLTIENPNHEVP